MTLTARASIVLAVTIRSGRAAIRHGSKARWLASLLLHALVLFFVVELSGLAHAALDFAGAEQSQHDDCEDEESGHECPPGCATCHCWHAGTPTPPLSVRCELQLVVLRGARLGFRPHAANAPPGADLDALYRPPRLARAV